MKSFQDIIVAKSIKDVVERGFHLSRKRSITNFTSALLNKKKQQDSNFIERFFTQAST